MNIESKEVTYTNGLVISASGGSPSVYTATWNYKSGSMIRFGIMLVFAFLAVYLF